MQYADWQEKNRKAILERLRWLVSQPQGTIYLRSTGLHNIVIDKVGSQIHLIYLDPTASEIMSRVDIFDPLRLLAIYTQAMMLSLVWINNPKRVYIIGFGGGRVPMLLHHYFPSIEIESTDIEPAIVEVASRFFAIKYDSRLKVTIEDGRNYLDRRDSHVQYDMIMLDGFRGVGYGPYRFCTADFYNMCRSHLTDNGLVVANLLEGDQLYSDKIKTFYSSFKHTYLLRHDGANVLFGTDGSAIGKPEIVERAIELQKMYNFEFPLVERAREIIIEDQIATLIPELEQARLLTDANPPSGYFDSLSVQSTIFAKARRNDPCPCGSGKKFKRCHGLNSDENVL